PARGRRPRAAVVRGGRQPPQGRRAQCRSDRGATGCRRPDLDLSAQLPGYLGASLAPRWVQASRQRNASRKSSVSNRTVRPPTRCTPGARAHRSAALVLAMSASRAKGGSTTNGGRSFAASTASAAALRIRSLATVGCTLWATFRPNASFTATVRTPASRFSASAQVLSSPVTSPTGTPWVPAYAALRSVSDHGSPLIRTSYKRRPEYVWSSTAAWVPAGA